MDSVIHKDEITPILEQIKALNYDLIRVRNFMIMNRIHNGEELLEKALTEIRTLQNIFNKKLRWQLNAILIFILELKLYIPY